MYKCVMNTATVYCALALLCPFEGTLCSRWNVWWVKDTMKWYRSISLSIGMGWRLPHSSPFMFDWFKIEVLYCSVVEFRVQNSTRIRHGHSNKSNLSKKKKSPNSYLLGPCRQQLCHQLENNIKLTLSDITKNSELCGRIVILHGAHYFP